MNTIREHKKDWDGVWWHFLRVECDECGFIGELDTNENDVNPRFCVRGNHGSIECPTCGTAIGFSRPD